MPVDITNKKNIYSDNAQRAPSHNLPSNHYSLYLKRPTYEDKILKSLLRENPITLIWGQGGSGKSAIAYNILYSLIKDDTYADKLDKVFWFSDADNPGSLTIRDIIDEIKFHIDSPSSSKSLTSIDDEIRSINKYFDSSKISIIAIDNFETVTDQAVFDYLFTKLPLGCKLLLVSKYRAHYYMENGIINQRLEESINEIEISKLTRENWNKLFEIKSNGNESFRRWQERIPQKELNRILSLVYDRYGGNVLFMLHMISQIVKKGYITYDSIESILNQTPLSSYEHALDRVITTSWNLISNNAKRFLYAAALRSDSVIDLQETAIFSDLGSIEGLDSDLNKAINDCCDMCLVEQSYGGNNGVEYVLNALVYRFINDKINLGECDQDIIDNWIGYYVTIADSIGFCYNDVSRLKWFDEPTKKSSLFKLLNYCYSKERYAEYISITKNLRYFFYTRSIWENGENCIHLKRASAAKKINDYTEELEALIYYINIAAKYKQFDGLDKYISRAREIFDTNPSIPYEIYFRFVHAEALYYYGLGNYPVALNLWNEILSGNNICLATIHDIDAASRWRLKCLSKYENYDSKKLIFLCEELINDAINHNFSRAIIDLTLFIAEAYINSNDFINAKNRLDGIQESIYEVNDSLYLAKYHYLCAIVYGRCPTGVDHLVKAYELREKLKAHSSFTNYEKLIADQEIFNFKLCIIRHLPTKNNLADVFIGHMDLDCDQHYISRNSAQIKAIKKAVAFRKFSKLYVSPLKRALTTAKLYAPKGIERIIDRRLIERDLGEWSNVSKDKLRKEIPDAFFSDGRLNFHFTPPKGESYSDMIVRVLGFIAELVECSEENEQLIVTHNGVITVIKCLLKGSFNTDDIKSQPHLDILDVELDAKTVVTIKNIINNVEGFI